MEKDHNYGTNCNVNSMVKTDSVVMFALTFEAAVVFPANFMRQEDLPNEVTWQKTQTSAQDPLPGHESQQAAIVLLPRTDNSVWKGM